MREVGHIWVYGKRTRERGLLRMMPLSWMCEKLFCSCWWVLTTDRGCCYVWWTGATNSQCALSQRATREQQSTCLVSMSFSKLWWGQEMQTEGTCEAACAFQAQEKLRVWYLWCCSGLYPSNLSGNWNQRVLSSSWSLNRWFLWRRWKRLFRLRLEFFERSEGYRSACQMWASEFDW